MQPAIFDDGQTLSSTHYHIDACFWKGDRFIDGTTFLFPSKLPKVGLEFYTVDLDEVTGIHHVALRKMSLRTILSLINPSNPQFSSHIVEISNGEMIAVPRVSFAVPESKRKARKFGQDDKVERVRDQAADKQPCLAGRSVATLHDVIPIETYSTPVGLTSSMSRSAPVSRQVTSHSATSGSLFRKLSPDLIVATSYAPDDSIIWSGHVVGQRAADDQSSLSNFPESIIHILPRNVAAPISIDAEGPDAAAPVQKPVEVAIDTETSTISTSSRRPSNGDQSDGNATSTVPTSPSSPTFSTMSDWKSALANLPELPIAPGKPSRTIKAQALEESKKHDPEKTNDPDSAVVRRRSWDLAITVRQFKYWDEIQEYSKSPCLEYVPASGSDLTMTEDGQIIMKGDISNNDQSSLTLPQLTSEPTEVRHSLASWSSSPWRIRRGECDHSYKVVPRPREEKRHPDHDWNFLDMEPGCAEQFNLACTLERTLVDPDFDNYILKLFGPGTLAQEFRSGQGIIPRTTSRMMTVLGDGAIKTMMNGCSIPRATGGMVTLLGTVNIPQTRYVY